MPAFRIIHVEPTTQFTLYHLDTPKLGVTAIVSFRAAPTELEPTLTTVHRNRLCFDFEIETSRAAPHDDPRLQTAAEIRALTLSHR